MKKIFLCIVSAALIVAGSIFLQSCEGMDFFNGKDEIDETIVNSVELENFIMAAMAVEQARMAFTEELNNIDFSALKVTYDENGRRIKHLPNAISWDMGEKIQTLNATRDDLRRTFPQLVSLEQDVVIEHFHQSIQRSENLMGMYFELYTGYSHSQPRLRQGIELLKFHSCSRVLWTSLSGWVRYANSVEKTIIGFANGSIGTIIHPHATRYETGDFRFHIIGGSVWLPGWNNYSPVEWIGHTHPIGVVAPGRRYGWEPSDCDLNSRDRFPQVRHYIFYCNRLHNFNNW